MTNPSGTPHSIGVDVNGVDKDSPQTSVTNGQTATVTATLKPGKYDLLLSGRRAQAGRHEGHAHRARRPVARRRRDAEPRAAASAGTTPDIEARRARRTTS